MEEEIKEFPEIVREYIQEKNFDGIKNYIAQLSPPEIIEGMYQCRDEDQPIVFRLLPKDLAIKVFDIMEPPMQGAIVESLRNKEVIDLLGSLDPVDQVRLLDEMPAGVAKRLLSALPYKKRNIAAKLMGYEDGTVGRIMSPLFIDLKKHLTVSQALERIRQKKRGYEGDIHAVYITDATRQLEAVIHISALVTADPEIKIEELIPEDPPNAVYASQDQEEAAKLLQRLDVVELPVLDNENRLIGVMNVEDAMDVLSEEFTDDLYDKVGLLDIAKVESDRSYRLLHGSFLHVIAVRVPFLLITLAGGMLAGAVIDAFEQVLEAVVVTAVFIPVIMDMGGNVGTQSSTIFTRGVVLGHINLKQFLRHWGKEVLNGAGMGAILGAVGGFVAFLWQGLAPLGWAVGISMALTITLGIALGFLVPFFLIKLGFDQAAGSDPIITTIKDMSALLIYFTSVSLFLPHVV